MHYRRVGPGEWTARAKLQGICDGEVHASAFIQASTAAAIVAGIVAACAPVSPFNKGNTMARRQATLLPPGCGAGGLMQRANTPTEMEELLQ